MIKGQVIMTLPLALAPLRARNDSLNYQGTHFKKERRVGAPSVQGWFGVQ